MDVDANAVIQEISQQRNEAQDQVAMLRAALAQANAELAELKEGDN